MKVNNRVKQLLGACLAVGMLASLAACQRQDGPEQPTGVETTNPTAESVQVMETTEETGAVKTTTPQDGKKKPGSTPSKATEPNESVPATQSKEEKPSENPSNGSQSNSSQPSETPSSSNSSKPSGGSQSGGNGSSGSKPSSDSPATKPAETKPTVTKPAETKPAHTHSYKSTVTAPTCTAKGYTTYQCSCGDSYKDSYTEALGHSYGDWATTREATTEEEGLQTRTCSRCGGTETRSIEKLPQPTEAGVTEAGIPSLEAYARSYAESLGFTPDTSMHKGNSGYYPAVYMSSSSIEAAKSSIRDSIECTKGLLIAANGTIEGCRYNCIIEIDSYGGFEIYDLYG